ncbi:IS3 family transposase [Streptococcus porcinus]
MQQIKAYMDWYNCDRPKEILKGMAPYAIQGNIPY